VSVIIHLCCADSACLCSMDFTSGSKIEKKLNIIFKNHCMLVGKYIFVIFLSLFIIRSFRGMGFGSGRQGHTKILKFDIFPSIFAKKGCFLSFEWWKRNFTTFGHPYKIFLARPRKSTIGPFLEKIPPVAMFRGTCSSIEMLKRCTDRESLGTPGL